MRFVVFQPLRVLLGVQVVGALLGLVGDGGGVVEGVFHATLANDVCVHFMVVENKFKIYEV